MHLCHHLNTEKITYIRKRTIELVYSMHNIKQHVVPNNKLAL